MISGFKKSNKKKGKLVLAKDPKQAAIAAFVIVLFIINSIYTAVKIYNENNPPPEPTVEEAAAPQPEMPPEGQNPADATAGQPSDSTNPSEGSGGMSGDAANNVYFQTISMKENTGNGPDTQIATDGSIDIMTKTNGAKRFGKTVLISVDNSESANPFLPNNGSSPITARKKAVSLPFLTLPPETVSPTSSDTGRIMTTTISGILYDKYNPSAIINIEGSDYLVKRGDVINHYKVLFIGKNEVIVQLGRNIYKAGVGQLLSLTDLNYNTIANLNKKFGGNNVQIKVKKKG